MTTTQESAQEQATKGRRRQRAGNDRADCASHLNPGDFETHGDGVILYRFMGKADFEVLMAYEKARGYELNRMPNSRFIKSIGAKERLLVCWAAVHNGVELRVKVVRRSGQTAMVDMPFAAYLQLETKAWNWHRTQPPPAWVQELAVLSGRANAP